MGAQKTKIGVTIAEEGLLAPSQSIPMQAASESPPIINVDPRPSSESGKQSMTELLKATFEDYTALYALNRASTIRPALSKERLCRVIPLSLFVYILWVFIFLIIEVSGGAGGTSSLAETRAATLFMIYLFLLFPTALYIAKRAHYIQNSSIVTTFALASAVLLSAEIGSSFSTFGVCAESSCGIDSKNRGAKNVFEVLFYLVFGVPPLVAAFQAALEIEMAIRLPSAQLSGQRSGGGSGDKADRSLYRSQSNNHSNASRGSTNMFGGVVHKSQSLPTPLSNPLQQQAVEQLQHALQQQNQSPLPADVAAAAARELPYPSIREVSGGEEVGGVGGWGGVGGGSHGGSRSNLNGRGPGDTSHGGTGTTLQPGSKITALHDQLARREETAVASSSFVLGHLSHPPAHPAAASSRTSSSDPHRPPSSPGPTSRNSANLRPASQAEVDHQVDSLINQFLASDGRNGKP